MSKELFGVVVAIGIFNLRDRCILLRPYDAEDADSIYAVVFVEAPENDSQVATLIGNCWKPEPVASPLAMKLAFLKEGSAVKLTLGYGVDVEDLQIGKVPDWSFQVPFQDLDFDYDYVPKRKKPTTEPRFPFAHDEP